MHAYIHTYIHMYIHACMHAYIHTSMHTYIHTYILPSIHPYIHTYILYIFYIWISVNIVSLQMVSTKNGPGFKQFSYDPRTKICWRIVRPSSLWFILSFRACHFALLNSLLQNPPSFTLTSYEILHQSYLLKCWL